MDFELDGGDFGAEPLDLGLLLSISSGLGHTQPSEDGRKQLYVRDPDCVGARPRIEMRMRLHAMSRASDFACGASACTPPSTRPLLRPLAFSCAMHVHISACLKDLQRFLRRDDPGEREAFYYLGSIGIAKRDLLPLLLAYADQPDVVYNAREYMCTITALQSLRSGGCRDRGRLRQVRHGQQAQRSHS